jgi:hypothetical protein
MMTEEILSSILVTIDSGSGLAVKSKSPGLYRISPALALKYAPHQYRAEDIPETPILSLDQRAINVY